MVPGPLEQGFCAGQAQLLPGTSMRLPGRRYEAICSWSLPVLGYCSQGWSWLPATERVFQDVRAEASWLLIKGLPAWGRAGCPATKLPRSICKLGGASGSHGVEPEDLNRQMQIQNWLCGGGLNTGKMVPACSCTGGGLNKGTIAAVPPALALKPYNSDFLRMSLVPPKLLSLHWNSG